jgi:hypothetical protein
MRYIRHDLMKGRDPNKGRHAVGSPIARNIFTPNSRTGSASGNFVGTGVNRKTAAGPEHSPSRSSASTNDTRQAEQFVGQSPEPFRNPVRSSNPLGQVSRDSSQGSPYGDPAAALRPGDWRRAQPQRGPHSQEEINRATGHPGDYEPAGQNATVGVRRQQARAGEINLPGGPRAKSLNSGRPNPANWNGANAPSRGMKTNRDLFGPGMEAFRRRDGGRSSVL